MTMPPMPPVNPGNLLGGAAGSLAGTNVLQQSIDNLTNAVNNLSNTVQTTNFGAGGLNNNATRQQRQQGNNTTFPGMINPFRRNQLQPGIGGGGPGGTGNVSAPNTFGRGIATVASAAVSFGTQQMIPQLTLNQYATSAVMTTTNAPYQSRGQQMAQMYSAVGATPGSMNNLSNGNIADNIQMAMTLSQLAGVAPSQLRRTSLGRAGLGATAAFGITNPTLSATTDSQLAAALYSPSFSQNMMALGYRPIRSMNGGAPMNAGQSAQSILQGMLSNYGTRGVTQANLYGNLSSPRGQAVLSSLFGPSGISNSQAVSYLSGYNQLFQRGYTPAAATNLFTQAAGGPGITTAQAKSAQQQLNQAGVSTAGNDLQALKNAQAVVTGRMSDYAGGFNDAIQQSTGLLESFNSALNQILRGPLGSAVGYGGGFGGVLAGTSGTVNTLGALGGIRMLLGGRGAAAAAQTAAGTAARTGGIGGTLGAAGAGLSAAAGPIGVGVGLGAGIRAVGNAMSPAGTTSGRVNNAIQDYTARSGQTGAFGLSGIIARIATNIAGIGGGAAPVGSAKTMQGTGGNPMNVTNGAARSAISAAESQIGVPYEWGKEIPGVGFDCSALVQWAYKQAGVSLPRTSQEQWKALSGRSIPLDKVQAGDLVFKAGADGSFASPGHVGMMVSANRLIQAPRTGQDVEIIGYDPRGWQHAGRPSGSGSFIPGSTASTLSSSKNSLPGMSGNRGVGSSLGGSYGSVNEVDVIAAMGSGSMGRGSGSSNGTSGSANTITGGSSVKHGVEGSTSIPKGASQIVAAAKRIAQGYGWSTGDQWSDFLKVVNHEDASWSPTAMNPSGAYGIPQALPGSKMASAGPDWRTNPNTQLKWMFQYIQQRYGTPTGAWQHEQQLGWYSAGGTTLPGLALVGERGPELMMTGGGQQVFSNSQTMQLINAIRGSSPAQSPWKTDLTSGASMSSGSHTHIHFNKGSISITSSGSTTSDMSKAGREVANQILKQLSDESVHSAIRRGDKL